MAGLCTDDDLMRAAGSGHPPTSALSYRAGFNLGHFESDLDFFNGLHASISEDSATGTLEIRPPGRWSFQIGAGAILGGSLRSSNHLWSIAPGWVYSVGFTHRLLDGVGWRPWIVFGMSLSWTGAFTTTTYGNGTDRTGILSTDLGATLSVGKTFFRTLSPYVMLRVFGGPIVWRPTGALTVGGDDYHFQLGAGVVVTLFRRLDAYVEGVPLGERRVSAGGGMSF